MMNVQVVQVKKNILAKNDELAAGIRQKLKDRHIAALNFVSSPGAGKTSLLVKTLGDLKERAGFAVIEGDQETDNDARRIAETGVPVVQVNTMSACHLDANMTSEALSKLSLDHLEFLLIENVGNLVCPASYDLGEMMKVVVMSVTEGEDKPAKYPKMFRVSSAMVITKIDLLPHLDFDIDKAIDYALRINPSLKIFKTSVKSGEGLGEWYDYLLSLRHG